MKVHSTIVSPLVHFFYPHNCIGCGSDIIEKEFKRGFNQSSILCSGINEVTNIPVITKNVIRIVHTETQTKKGRIQRWENVEKSFSVIEPEILRGKHILLVDDVITTGASIEAWGREILKIDGVQVSVASLAISKK